jgi:hypothetical protein
VKLTNYENYNYIGEFYVGSQKQKMRGCFDTGSANSWILSTEDKDTVNKGENLAFNPQESTTFVSTNVGESIQFGSGSL